VATQVYETKTIYLLDGTEIELKPLKIKYLRKVMDTFGQIFEAKDDTDSMQILARCAFYSLQQYYPSKAKTIEDVEDNINMPIIYEILDVGAGIKFNDKNDDEKPIKNKASNEQGRTWDDFDLLKIETEVFLLGIWKDFDELESNMSIPEIISILSTKRELDYDEKKFLAALQGVDLDKNNKNSNQNAWEEMKARVFSRGATSDPDDVLSLQGHKAQQLGFGIGMGLDYDDARDPNLMKN
jgi:hypothetical protein